MQQPCGHPAESPAKVSANSPRHSPAPSAPLHRAVLTRPRPSFSFTSRMKLPSLELLRGGAGTAGVGVCREAGPEAPRGAGPRSGPGGPHTFLLRLPTILTRNLRHHASRLVLL